MDVQKLAKVLAMAASDNDAEALHALRTASRLLGNAGLDFVALADRLADSGPAVSATRLEDLEDTVFDLRNEIRHLRSENQRLRQGQPGSPAATAAAAPTAPNLADSASLIRLQVELEAARQDLQRRQAEAEAVELALRADLGRAVEGLERLAGQCEQIKARNDRLEAENRRLGLMASAVKAELDERIADSLHPLPPSRPVVMPEPPRMEAAAAPPVPPRRAAPHAPARRVAKPGALPANQYALF